MKFLKTSARVLCFLILGALPGVIFAADQCTIEKGPDTALSQYITNLDTALEKLKDSTKNASCGALGGKNVPSSSENIERAAALIVRGTNRALNQDCYLGAAAFNTELALKSETPTALRRDLKLLVSKQEDLTLAVDQLYQTCGQNTSLETQTILPGESGNMSAGEIAETLIKNHTSIVCLYRNVTTGRPPLETQFLLTPTDFTSKIQTAYGPGAIQSCTVRGDVFKRLSTAITKVGETARNLKGKMSEWQNSNQALESEDEKRARATKESELAPKLKKAGLLENTSDVTLRAAGNYNTPDSTSGISGFLRDTGLRIAQGFEKMKGLYSFTPKPETAPDTDAWIARYKNIQTLQADVAKDVLERYQLLMDQIGEEQVLKDSIEGRLGRIYIELESGTRLLEPYKKVARDVCNSQTSNEKGAGCNQ